MQEPRREIIRESWEARRGISRSAFVRNMINVGFKRRTIYDTLKRLETIGTVARKPGSGRKIQGWTKSKEKRLCHAADHKTGLTYSSLGRRFGISHVTVKKYLNRNNIINRRRRNAPKSSEKQKKVQKTRLRKLSRRVLSAGNDHVDVIMDDETYFDENGMNFYGNTNYFSSQPELTPKNVKFKEKTKYPFKIMVWLAISNKGRTSVFIKITKGAVNSEVYKNECLKKRLIPFIRKHYPDGNYVFWPDLASAHYSGNTQKFMREEGINFVPKEFNPPNLPNLRPIESFWAKLKQDVYSKGWVPKNFEDLHDRIVKIIKKLGSTVGESFMTNVSKKVRLADRHGTLFNI